MSPDERRERDRGYYAKMSVARRSRKQVLQNDRRLGITRTIQDYKSTMKCTCGESHPGCLDFHHVSDDKEINVADALRHGWSIKRLMTEIEKCIVICSNCHRKLHYVRYLGVAQSG